MQATVHNTAAPGDRGVGDNPATISARGETLDVVAMEDAGSDGLPHEAAESRALSRRTGELKMTFVDMTGFHRGANHGLPGGLASCNR